MTRRQSFLLPFLLWWVLAVLRMLAPSTLDDKDQPKVAFYTTDIVERGRWLLQYSDGDDVATKPPLYQWTAAVVSLTVGRLNEYTLLLPSLLSGFFVLLIVWDWGRTFGRRVMEEADSSGSRGNTAPAGAASDRELSANSMACLAALIWVTTYHVQRLQWTARTDMMATAFGLGALWAAARLGNARSTNHRALWRWVFWGLISLGALAKGHVPLAVALSALAAECILRRTAKPLLDLWPWFGLPIVAGVFAMWFFAAWVAGGKVFWDTLVGAEFLDRVTGTGARAENARPIFYYIPIFLGRSLPWSALLVLASPRWWREGLLRPSRRHPFLPAAAWLLGILLVFSLPRGKRPDYILPAYAPAAVLVAALLLDWRRRGWAALGWGKAKAWTRRASQEALAAVQPASPVVRRQAVTGLFAIATLGTLLYFWLGSEAAHTHSADRTRRFGVKAALILTEDPGALVYCDPKSSLVQFYLRTNKVPLSLGDCAAWIRDAVSPGLPGESPPVEAGPRYIVTRLTRVEKLRQALGDTWHGRLDSLLTEEPGPEEPGPLVLLRVQPGFGTPSSSND